MTDAAFELVQRGVAKRMVAAMLVALGAIGGALVWGSPATMSERMNVAILVAMTMAGWLAAAVGNVARLHFFSPEDIAGGGKTEGSARIRTASAILQNTLEQVTLAIPVVVAAAITIDRSTALLVVLGALFATGRALFWHGYARGATARALGFALTFYPSAMTVLVVAAAIFIA